jgi:hypothetical protein
MPIFTVMKLGSSLTVSTYTASSWPILLPSGSITFRPRQSRKFSAANILLSTQQRCVAIGTANL